MNSTVIELCAPAFDWARFRATKGAVRLHLLLDHDGHLPCFAAITIAQQLKLPKGSLVVMDQGNTDDHLYEPWSGESIGFVTRLKNADWSNVEGPPFRDGGIIRRDTIGEFNCFLAGRRIKTS